MTVTITDGTTTVDADVLASSRLDNPGRSKVHPPLDGTVPDITLRPAGALTGSLDLRVETFSDAVDVRAVHTSGSVVSMSGDLSMSYVVSESGSVGWPAPQDDGTWTVTVSGVQEGP